MSTKIAFIGLGNIGSGAAANLVQAGYPVRVADLDPQRVEALESLGAEAASSAIEACIQADVVFTSLPGPKQIAAVGHEILPVLAPGAIWVELSTNDLETAGAMRALARSHEVSLIDAPVSGGPEGAAAGTLSVFVGADDESFAAVKPLLDTIGGRVDHLGPGGAGIVAKIAQVTLCYTQTVTLIEALLLGAKGGVAPAKMLELIRHSAGASYCADTYGPEILAGTYDASFPVGHAAKDMRLAMNLATTVGADLPFTTQVAALYNETEAIYGPDAAHCLAAQLLERRNDLILHTADSTPPTAPPATENPAHDQPRR